MAEKFSESGESLPIIGGKRVERPSSSSSPDIPPKKTAKTTEHVVEHADLSSIWVALNNIQRNTDELLKENRALRKQHEELHKSLEFHIDKLEKLEAENDKLKQDVSSLKKAVRKAEDDVADLNDDLDGLKSDLDSAICQIDDLEQYNRKHNLEIHGFPESSEENLSDKIIKLGKVLNVPIVNNDIDICHRMATKRSNGGPRPIIVRFRSLRAKSELYKSKKHLRPVSLNYFHGAEAAYINENLRATCCKDHLYLCKIEKNRFYENLSGRRFLLTCFKTVTLNLFGFLFSSPDRLLYFARERAKLGPEIALFAKAGKPKILCVAGKANPYY